MEFRDLFRRGAQWHWALGGRGLVWKLTYIDAYSLEVQYYFESWSEKETRS